MSWTQTRLKYLCEDPGQYGLNVSTDYYQDDGLRLLRTSDISADGALKPVDSAVYVDVTPEHRHRLRAGDLLVSRSGTLGRSFLVPAEVDNQTFAGFLVRFRPRPDVDSRFLYYWTLSVGFQNSVKSAAVSSTIQNFNAERYANIALCAPPLEEQRRIADFLDAETARIDKLRAAREKQAEVLEERAMRRVCDTVRGTDIPGKRRPSSLSWLGSIPERWRVAAVSHYFEVELGKMLNEERTRGGYLRPYLRVANVQWGKVDTSELAVMNFPPEEQGRYRVRAGDLLVNEGGSWPGRAAVWNGEIAEIYYQKALHRIRSRGEELTSWLYFCLVVAERMRVFQVQGNSSTMTHLTREQLRPQRFPFPSVDEQERFVKYLQQCERRDRELNDALSRQLDLLAERRQALITAAVTGEIDVSTASGRGIEE